MLARLNSYNKMNLYVLFKLPQIHLFFELSAFR